MYSVVLQRMTCDIFKSLLQASYRLKINAIIEIKSFVAAAFAKSTSHFYPADLKRALKTVSLFYISCTELVYTDTFTF